jgi:hypothetical protein
MVRSLGYTAKIITHIGIFYQETWPRQQSLKNYPVKFLYHHTGRSSVFFSFMIVGYFPCQFATKFAV